MSWVRAHLVRGLREVAMRWAWGLVLSVVAGACLAVALLLAGVALVLHARAPAAVASAGWMLVVAPLAPVAVAAACTSVVVMGWRRPSLVRPQALR